MLAKGFSNLYKTDRAIINTMNKEMNERYRFIEQVVGWEGEINSTHISDKFSLTRQA
jgi:hypothetical protein